MDARDPGKRYHISVVGAVEAATIEARLAEERKHETARTVIRRQPLLPEKKGPLVDLSKKVEESGVIDEKTLSPPPFTATAWQRKRDEQRRAKQEREEAIARGEIDPDDENAVEFDERNVPTVYRIYEANSGQLEELNKKVNYLKLLEKEALAAEAALHKERKVKEELRAAEQEGRGDGKRVTLMEFYRIVIVTR